jgi:hypothetical protein
MPTHTELANFIWSVADLLRGDYKQSEYGKVILPFTVLRRLDCVMAPTREAVWAKHKVINVQNQDAILYRAAGRPAVLQPVSPGLRHHRRRPGRRRRQPDRLLQRLLRQRPRDP